MSDYLPNHVIVEEILHRLPLKSIRKCMLVCKAWNTMIKSHTFIFSHLQHSLSNIPSSPPPMVIMSNFSPSDKQNFSLCSSSFQTIIENIKHSFPNELPYHIRCVGAINGVVCLYNHGLEFTYNNIILWNPLIDRHLKLPTPLFTFETFGHFNEERLGFGFDSKRNDFKVVRLSNIWGDYMVPPKVELYSLNEGAWRVIHNNDDDDVASSLGFLRKRISNNTPCFFNGNVHWVAYVKYAIPDCILMFNVVEEKFNQMELPEEVKNNVWFWDNLVVSVIQDCFSLIEYIGGSDFHIQRCNIWMKRESWNKVSSFYFQGGIRNVLVLDTSSEVLVVTEDKPMSFHFVDHKKSIIGVKDIGIQISKNAWANHYIESLVLLDKENNAAMNNIMEDELKTGS